MRGILRRCRYSTSRIGSHTSTLSDPDRKDGRLPAGPRSYRCCLLATTESRRRRHLPPSNEAIGCPSALSCGLTLNGYCECHDACIELSKTQRRNGIQHVTFPWLTPSPAPYSLVTSILGSSISLMFLSIPWTVTTASRAGRHCFRSVYLPFPHHFTWSFSPLFSGWLI